MPLLQPGQTDMSVLVYFGSRADKKKRMVQHYKEFGNRITK